MVLNFTILGFDLPNFNFYNVTKLIIIFLQFNSYCKITIKFVTINISEEYDTIFERIIES